VLATAAAPIAGCASPPAAAGGGEAGGGGEACAPYDRDWDYARVKPEPQKLAEAAARAEQAHREVRAKAGLDPESPGGERVRVLTWGTMLPGRWSTVATRMGNGQWEVVQAYEGREGGRGPGPEAPSVKVARIEGEAQARLAKLVEDACLFSEPTYYGRSVPTTEGGEAACADGSDQVIEVYVFKRRHVSFHACHGFGRAGEVSNILWSAVSGG